MSDELQRYLALEQAALYERDDDSLNTTLDEMDKAWYAMTEEDRQYLRNQRSQRESNA